MNLLCLVHITLDSVGMSIIYAFDEFLMGEIIGKSPETELLERHIYGIRTVSYCHFEL